MSLAANAHESAVKELKQMNSSSEERIEELFALVTPKRSSALPSVNRQPSVSREVSFNREVSFSREASVNRQTTPIANRPAVTRSSSVVAQTLGQSVVPVRQAADVSLLSGRTSSPTGQRGRVTPLRGCASLPQPPSSIVGTQSCVAPPGDTVKVRQLPVTASASILTTPCTTGTGSYSPMSPRTVNASPQSSVEGSALQRVPSVGRLSARFSASTLPRNDSRRLIGAAP